MIFNYTKFKGVFLWIKKCFSASVSNIALLLQSHMTDFSSLGIEPMLLEAIEALGFQTPTEIQQQAIPILLTQEKDMVALAQTGTGKTAAFGIPMLQRIDANSRITQGLVIAPTRELCLQISKELAKYASKIK